VTVNKVNKEMDMPQGATVSTLLESLGLFPDANIVLRKKVPVPLGELLEEGDALRIVRVASGG
jgi:sulfur carrier protein ThiS